MSYLWFLLLIIAKSSLILCDLCDFNSTCHGPEHQFTCHQVDQSYCKDFTIALAHYKKGLGSEKIQKTSKSINITFENINWDSLYLKISNETTESCLKILNTKKTKNISFNCFKLFNGTYLFQYELIHDVKKVAKRLQINNYHRKLFTYVDITDTYCLYLKLQPLNYSTTYKVEVYREKNNITSLQDLRLFDSDGKGLITYEYFTYNEEGEYFFIVYVMEKGCPIEGCKVTVTSKIYIGRKNPTLVIGIVGASFILPFVLFLFHILTKNYRNRKGVQCEDSILIIYQVSSQKNVEIVQILAKLLRELLEIDVNLDVITKEKICSDLLTTSTYIVYVNYPNTVTLDFNTIKEIIPNKEFIEITFNLSTQNNFPHKKFKLIDEFDAFMKEFEPEGDLNYEDHSLFKELRMKIKELKAEMEKVPKILVTEEELHELITPTLDV